MFVEYFGLQLQRVRERDNWWLARRLRVFGFGSDYFSSYRDCDYGCDLDCRVIIYESGYNFVGNSIRVVDSVVLVNLGKPKTKRLRLQQDSMGGSVLST